MKRFSALLLALCLCVSLIVTGCGGKETSSTPAPASEPVSNAAAAAPDKDLTIGFNTDIQSLDPHNASDTLSMSVLGSMYESLIAFDENQKLTGELAESWEVADDNLTYTFKLRKDVKFHDGEPFNAEAVKKNYERCMADEKLRQYRTVKDWESVTVVDENTVAIKLKFPNSSFLNKMALYRMASPKTLENGKDFLIKNPCGTGAYIYKERVEGDHVTVVPFDGYWGDKPGVSSVTFKAVPEDGARIAMLQTGEADYIYPMPAIQAPNLDGKKDIKVTAAPSNIMRYVTLRTNLPELSDKRVRQAMNYAIDKAAYNKTVFNGYAEQVNSCFPSTVLYYSEQSPYDFNLEKAKALMKEAGYEKGFKLTLWGDNISNEMKGMQFVQQQLKQINIDVEVVPFEPNTLGDKIYVDPDKAEINMWYVNWSASSFDADGSMRNILHSEKMPPVSANTAYYNNPEFDKALDAAQRETDPAKLTELYAKAQKTVWEDAPWLFLGSDQVIAGQKTYVSGINLGPDGGLDITKAKLE